MKRIITLLSVAATLFMISEYAPEPTANADSGPVPGLTGPVDSDFGDYWYQGEAEITSYTLEQARYGETHTGHAVMIFVTEDFSKDKHVKLDRPEQAGKDKVNVLKLNLTRKFNTGIYPYSMMSSVFTPIQRQIHPQTLKVTTSTQEWCGQTFGQIDLADSTYEIVNYSYFESEGDQIVSLESVLLEDEIWNTIRLNPADLPAGNIKIIPGTLYQRLSHADWQVQDALAESVPVPGNADLVAFRLHYPNFDRVLTIQYEKAFPHEIQAWEDTYSSGRRGQATTRATLNRRVMLDYWSKNKSGDEALRKDLNLD